MNGRVVGVEGSVFFTGRSELFLFIVVKVGFFFVVVFGFCFLNVLDYFIG